MTSRTHGPGARVSRRDFARLLALGGSATLASPSVLAGTLSRAARALPPPPQQPDERFWREVRAQFLVPADLAVLNAANLCPSPAPVLDVTIEATRSVERDPSSYNRERTHQGREEARRRLAAFLRTGPEEIVITRNTSEANNLVSSGLALGPGDEVVVFADNHPSNLAAWHEKARRAGFAVRTVEQPTPHPGPEYYVDAVRRQLTARTRLVAFTHVTNSVGDVLPAAELCRVAREHGARSLVDGAQSLGVLDVDLRVMRPDFYTGSAHKWPCGPKETGLLYVRLDAQPLLAPSVVSLYAGDIGASKTLEAYGQRDEPAIMGFGAAIEFQTRIGLPHIEARARELTQALVEGLAKIAGVQLWTSPDPARRSTVVTFKPAGLDPGRLARALYERDRIVCAARTGADRPGIRLSPHFYNRHEEIDRTLAAVRTHIAGGA